MKFVRLFLIFAFVIVSFAFIQWPNGRSGTEKNEHVTPHQIDDIAVQSSHTKNLEKKYVQNEDIPLTPDDRRARSDKINMETADDFFDFFADDGSFREANLIRALDMPDFRDVLNSVERGATADERAKSSEIYSQLTLNLRNISVSVQVACGSGVCAAHFRDFDEKHMSSLSNMAAEIDLGPRIIMPINGGLIASEFKVIYAIKKTPDGSITISSK